MSSQPKTNPHCIHCAHESRFKFSVRSFKNPFDIFECSACGLQFQHPMPSAQTLEEYYGADYYSGKADFAYQDERDKFKFYSYVWQARLKKIMKYVKTAGNGRNFLDIGCSFGGLLSNAENLGFKAWGVEISDYSRAYAQKSFPGRIFKTMEETAFKPGFFDAVSMIEVIEHLDRPLNILSECFRILKPGGVLVLQTADMAGRQAVKAGAAYHYYLPGHLYYFSASNLKAMLKKAGFSRIIVFRPVDFGLVPKLKKSRGNFKKLKDYLQWGKISWYHFKGLIHCKNFSLTSSMVIYAVK